MRVAGLDVLGEDQHADLGVLGADPLGGDEALVGVRRRHADVDDRGVGALEPHLSEQALGVIRLGHHVDAGVGEQAHDPLTREHHVVGDDYSHGISARSVVSPSSSVPPSAPTRSARCGKWPTAWPSLVVRRDREASVRAVDADGEERRASPRRVLDRLGHGHVGRRLDRGRLAL